MANAKIISMIDSATQRAAAREAIILEALALTQRDVAQLRIDVDNLMRGLRDSGQSPSPP